MTKGGLLDLDWTLVIPVIILVVFGLVTLFSINVDLFKSQAIFFVVSIAAFLFFSNTHMPLLQRFSMHIYIASLMLLTFVLVLGIESRGAVRWIDIFGIRIQFSEILKPFLIVSFATYLSKQKNYNLATLCATILFLLSITFLIYKQPDLGNALIYFGTAILTMLVAGFPLRWFLGGVTILGVILPFAWNMLHDYQRQRVLTFLYPGSDPLGTSYNAMQSLVAVGSGMFFGKGLGEGTQSGLRFLPERHTDFIFATLSEEFGLIGASVVLIVFTYLLYRMYCVYKTAQHPGYKLIAASAFSLILVQFFVNVGMNIGLLPIVGVTLPFVSYGGSSLLSSFILLGFLVAIKKDARERSVLEIR